MKPDEKENKANHASDKGDNPIDRVETTRPAQEIFPVDRSLNDENQQEDEKRINPDRDEEGK